MKDAKETPGGVAFSGTWETCYRANLWSRIASRVLWRVGEFAYKNEQDVYDAAKAIDWTRYFAVQKKIRVNVTAQKSPLKSLEFATLKVKDAVCDRFRDKLGSRPDVDRAAPDVRIHAYLEEAKGILYLDTSGEALFKRGWRMDIAEAPLRENLAAGIIMLSGWKFDQPLLDPMCGGGTLLSEAAAMARGRAPGAKRSFRLREIERVRCEAVGADQERENRRSRSSRGCTAATPIPRRCRPRAAISAPRASSAG